MFNCDGWIFPTGHVICFRIWLALSGALDKENILTDLEPIDVAKGLVAIHDRLPPWVGRTQGLSANAKRVRQLFKQASGS